MPSRVDPLVQNRPSGRGVDWACGHYSLLIPREVALFLWSRSVILPITLRFLVALDRLALWSRSVLLLLPTADLRERLLGVLFVVR